MNDLQSALIQMKNGQVQNAQASTNNARARAIDEKSKEFESVFLHQMMEHMFSGLDTGGPFGGGESEEIYRSFMLDEYSKIITRSGGIGVADHVKREMIAMQEKGK